MEASEWSISTFRFIGTSRKAGEQTKPIAIPIKKMHFNN